VHFYLAFWVFYIKYLLEANNKAGRGGRLIKVVSLRKGEVLNEGLESQTYIPARCLFRRLRDCNLYTDARTPESGQSVRR